MTEQPKVWLHRLPQ